MAKINLVGFDRDFLKTIPGYEKILLNKNGIYHCVEIDGEKAGVVGFVRASGSNFIQIALVESVRSKGLVGWIEDLLVEKYGLEQLKATIDLDNIASIKAHQKAGFRELNYKTLNFLKKNGLLKENQTRLVKNYLKEKNI